MCVFWPRFFARNLLGCQGPRRGIRPRPSFPVWAVWHSADHTPSRCPRWRGGCLMAATKFDRRSVQAEDGKCNLCSQWSMRVSAQQRMHCRVASGHRDVPELAAAPAMRMLWCSPTCDRLRRIQERLACCVASGGHALRPARDGLAATVPSVHEREQ